MKILHEAIEEVLQELPKLALSVLLEQKMAARGIHLSPGESKLLLKHLTEGGGDTFQIRRWRFWHQQDVKIELTQQDAEHVEGTFQGFVANQLPNILLALINDTSSEMLVTLKNKWRDESRQQHQELAGFADRLHGRWGKGLELLHMLVTISRELGASIREEISNSPDRNRKYLTEVLPRLHARSCQITEEILCLLAAGFADGAMARWRTLHEVAVIASFIADQGEDLAERYVLHQAIESKQGATEYEKYRERLGYEPLNDHEITALEDTCSALRARFGSDFARPHGWAAHHLSESDPNFKKIESAVGVDHLRPFYRMASHNVHANPKGVFFKLGLLSESQIFLAGPSNAGLADPGHATAISLAQITSRLGLLHPTFDNVVSVQIIAQLVEDVGAAFIAAHVQLENDAAERSI
jgi:Family of unknown function (DUF5677)